MYAIVKCHLHFATFFTHAILQTIQKIPLNVMTLEIVTKRVYTSKVNPDCHPVVKIVTIL